MSLVALSMIACLKYNLSFDILYALHFWLHFLFLSMLPTGHLGFWSWSGTHKDILDVLHYLLPFTFIEDELLHIYVTVLNI